MTRKEIKIQDQDEDEIGYCIIGGRFNMNEGIIICISTSLMIISLCAIYQGQPDISYVCVGALAGFLTKDILTNNIKEKEVETEDANENT